jgi:hypothetical protein
MLFLSSKISSALVASTAVVSVGREIFDLPAGLPTGRHLREAQRKIRNDLPALVRRAAKDPGRALDAKAGGIER